MSVSLEVAEHHDAITEIGRVLRELEGEQALGIRRPEHGEQLHMLRGALADARVRHEQLCIEHNYRPLDAAEQN